MDSPEVAEMFYDYLQNVNISTICIGSAEGQASDIRIRADHVIRVREKLNRILAANTCRSLEEIERDTDRDHFMSAEEALEYGLIDKIIRSRNER